MHFTQQPPTHELSYSDVFLVPSRSAIASRYDVDLSSIDGTGTTIPIVSANMNSVTGPRLATQLARRGGLGVLPQDGALEDRVAAIRAVKDALPGVESVEVFPSDARVQQALRAVPNLDQHVVAVTATDGQVIGLVSGSSLREASPASAIGTLIREVPSIDHAQLSDPRAIFDLLIAADAQHCRVMSEGRFVGVVSRAGAVRSATYRPALDANGRLTVAAAVGVNGDPVGAAESLIDAGANVIVVDTAHGHQENAITAVAAIAKRRFGVPLVAGNVVSADGVHDLVDAGATIVKVGVGPGAMCTTRMMTAVGRPQFSAVLTCAAAAATDGATIWADGGVRYPRDVALALAAGGSQVMIGSWFAGTIESPGGLLTDSDGRAYKESWGMASAKAVSDRFVAEPPFERERKRLFAEGISSSHIYLDPERPSLDDLLDLITSGVRSSFTYSGAATIPEFHDRAIIGVQSASGYEEGKALPVSW